MITAIGDVMREAYKRGWITTRDGNISLRRRDKDILYITPTGVRKATIIPETIIRMPIVDDKLVIDEFKASGELDMHWMLQRENRTRSVVHLHPTYIVAAMCAGIDLHELAKDFPEVHRYTRVGRNVPVLPATSNELARATHKNMVANGKLKCDIVGQAQHGVCAVGRHPWDAFEHIERLEHICQIAMISGKYA